ncbi:MAG: CHAP domain-containing protein [Deltaproteobacteria bacterium]|nr:CHAP domain-containing protein [Deltaproteobacteria bacterium]
MHHPSQRPGRDPGPRPRPAGRALPRLLLSGLALTLGAGCVTTGAGPGPGSLATDATSPPRHRERRPPPDLREQEQARADPAQRREPTHPGVAQRASTLVGAQRVIIEGKRHRADCSGLVRGLYAEAGHDLFALGALGEQRNGVAIIYRYVQRYGRLHGGRPEKGELVFFDNTYDANGNGRLDDALSHIGVVEKVRKDGTVVVVHYGGSGVDRLLVNIEHPDQRRNARGEPINDYLRRAKDGPRLAGELFVAWGWLPKARATMLVAHR